MRLMSTIEIQAPVAPYQHVRPLGEDIVATELVLPGSHRLRPQDLAACAAAGLTTWRCASHRTLPLSQLGQNSSPSVPSQTRRHRRVQLPHAWRHDGNGWHSDTLAFHS